MFERSASQVALMKPSFLGDRRRRKRRFIGRSLHSCCIVAHQGLTHRSSGPSKGCAFCLPLTSNVRPHVKTDRFVSIERSAKRFPSKAACVLLVHCWSRPPKPLHQTRPRFAFATHRRQSKAGFRSALALEAPAKENVSHSVDAAAMRGSGFSPRSGLLLLRFGHASHRQSSASRRPACFVSREA